MARRHRASKVCFAVGTVFVVAAITWSLVAVPQLVKYPTDVDASPKYTGTFSVYINPADMSPLATRLTAPMTIERHVRAIASESSASRVVVKETIVQKAGDLMDTTIENQYVMDRRSLKNVKDPRAWAFTPSNVVDRSGTYRLNLPFNMDPASVHAIYKNEIGGPYAMKPQALEVTEVEGLTLYGGRGVLAPQAVTAAWLEQLDQRVKLPATRTLEEAKPQLKAQGFDVDALLSQLRPLLTPDDAAAVAAIAAAPIPLQYTWSFDGKAAVERTTGAEVHVGPVTETLGVRARMADADGLTALLSRYADRAPAAAAALHALPEVTASHPLFGFTYDQTPESIRDIARSVKDQRRMILLAQRWLPLGLALCGGVSVLAGGLLWPRGTRRVRVGAGRTAPTHA